VAVVGFQKTGTTSLQVALEYLGYRVAVPSWPAIKAARSGDLDTLRAIAADHEAVQDTPWFMFFRELDEWFPGTKFVLTVRDEDAWMRSRRVHFDDHPELAQRYAPIQRFVFGDHPPPSVDEGPYRARYRAHNEAVIEHFKDRPGDLLVVRLGEGGEWERLCGHLGLPTPTGRGGGPVPFPHTNRSSARTDPQIRRRVRRLQRLRAVVVRVAGQTVADRLGRERRRLGVRRQLRRSSVD
jgi:predicted GNAT superfamily acetyltransferase